MSHHHQQNQIHSHEPSLRPSLHISHCLEGLQTHWLVKRINCEIRPNRPNRPIGESRISTCTCPTKVGPILLHGPPVETKAQTCPPRFEKLVLQARKACPASLKGLFSRPGWLAQQVCEACSARKGGKTSLL